MLLHVCLLKLKNLNNWLVDRFDSNRITLTSGCQLNQKTNKHFKESLKKFACKKLIFRLLNYFFLAENMFVCFFFNWSLIKIKNIYLFTLKRSNDSVVLLLLSETLIRGKKSEFNSLFMRTMATMKKDFI